MEQDELYEQAKFLVKTEKYIAVSLLQRHLMIGYNRADRLMNSLIEAGVVEKYDSGLNGIAYRLASNKP